MDILSVVTRVPILVFGFERHDDDFADRINYKYTVAVLVIFAIIVTNRQFGTKQIHCWIPAYFTRNYEEYINDICWVSNTYYISLDQKLPEAEQIRKSFELKYYQWVPFILLSQAFFFYIPHIAWRALSRRSGIDVRDIVEAAANYKSVDKYENRQKYMTYMLTAVDQYVDDPRRRKDTRRSLFIKRLLSGICCISGKFLGNYLMVLYLFIKLAFIGNCICQLFVLNLLLGHEFHKFGFELLDKIINGKGWDTGSRIFPKISMCDFRIREIGNPKVSHRYTVQCVLPINLFNQQIFTFIWFWYGIVLIVNIYSLCVWTYRFLPSKRLRYISRRIEIMRQALLWGQKNPLNFELIPDLHFHEFERELIGTFVHDYLESDGLFILRVLSSNTSDFVCTELIQELWKYYRKQRKFNRTSDGDDDDLNDDESIEYKKSYDDDFEPPPPAPLPQSAPKRAPRKATAASLNHLRPTATAAMSGSRQKIVRTRKKPLDEPPPFEQKSDEQLPNADTEQDTEPGTDGFDDEANEESNDQNATTEYNNGNGNGNGGARPRPVTAAARARKQPPKNTSKPLAVISEQVASMINKSKRPGGTETVTVAIAQHLTTATLPRPKMNRTLSVDPKVLNSVTTSTNGSNIGQVTERRLKRPTHFNRRLESVQQQHQPQEQSPQQRSSPVTAPAPASQSPSQQQQQPQSQQSKLNSLPTSPVAVTQSTQSPPPPPIPNTQPPPQSQTTSPPNENANNPTNSSRQHQHHPHNLLQLHQLHQSHPKPTDSPIIEHEPDSEHEPDNESAAENDDVDPHQTDQASTSNNGHSKLNNQNGKSKSSKYFETET